MSEFKFACPICGQHITADSKDTGSQIPCPTCYRKIVVPPAPAMDDPKFVLSASEVNKPRPQSPNPQSEGLPNTPKKSVLPLVLGILLVVACGAGATVFALREKIFHSKPPTGEAKDGNGDDSNSASSQPEYTGTNLWTLDLSDAKFPETPVEGSLHQRAFTIEHATLVGSNLTLRVGRSGPIELGLNILFFNHQPDELSGKTAEIKATDTTAPRVILRWKDAKRTSESFRSGYAMKIEFTPITNNALSGKIFLCLPDGSKSWVAGTFHAEIRKPSPPKPRAPSQHQTQ